MRPGKWATGICHGPGGGSTVGVPAPGDVVMAPGRWLLLFAAGVVVSLAASWLLVSRLERLGERAGFSEAWLGLVAALAADAPEITSAVTALAHGQAASGRGW